MARHTSVYPSADPDALSDIEFRFYKDEASGPIDYLLLHRFTGIYFPSFLFLTMKEKGVSSPADTLSVGDDTPTGVWVRFRSSAVWRDSTNNP